MDEAGVGADLSLGAHAVNNDPRQKVNEQLTTDLEVGAPTVIYGSQARGATFTLFAQVRNAGDGASAATTLRYYRSTDATITTADTAVGTDFVRGLAAGATSSESIAPDGPIDGGDVRLRRVRRRSDRRVRHDEQLLVIGAGHGAGANTSGSAHIVWWWDVAGQHRDRAWAVLHESIGGLLLGAAVRNRRDYC